MKLLPQFILYMVLAHAAMASPILNPGRGGKVCEAGMGGGIELPEVLHVPDCYQGNCREAPDVSQARSWEKDVMHLSSTAVISAAAAEKLKNKLLASASADTFKWSSGFNSGTHKEPATIYFTMEAIFPALIGYIQNKSRFSTSEQKIVEDWFGRTVDRLSKTEFLRKNRSDNKKYQYGAMLAAWGHIKNDPTILGESQKIFTTAIQFMRPDGSLPVDSGRGGNALFYTDHALANLVSIAEINIDHGVDLYKFEYEGRTLDTAIAFFISATRDPSLIAGYANSPNWQAGSFKGFSPKNQFRGYLSQEMMSWGYYYIKRFKKSDISKGLKSISPFLYANRSGFYSQAGGNVLCFTTQR